MRAFVAILSAALLSGCGRKEPAPLETAEPKNKLEEILRKAPKRKDADLSAFVHTSEPQRAVDGDGFRLMTGTIKNNYTNELHLIYIEFGLYDKDGVKLDTIFDSMPSLAIGETWKYKANLIDKEGAPKLLKITCEEGNIYKP